MQPKNRSQAYSRQGKLSPKKEEAATHMDILDMWNPEARGMNSFLSKKAW